MILIIIIKIGIHFPSFCILTYHQKTAVKHSHCFTLFPRITDRFRNKYVYPTDCCYLSCVYRIVLIILSVIRLQFCDARVIVYLSPTGAKLPLNRIDNMSQLEKIQYFAENKYAWPGGYPMFAICADNGVLCHKCTVGNGRVIGDEDGYIDPQWHVVGADINYEDVLLRCDNCYDVIESAYAVDSEAL